MIDSNLAFLVLLLVEIEEDEESGIIGDCPFLQLLFLLLPLGTEERLAAADSRIDAEGDNEAVEEANEPFDKLLVDVIIGSGGLFCLGEFDRDLVIYITEKRKKKQTKKNKRWKRQEKKSRYMEIVCIFIGTYMVIYAVSFVCE